MIITGIASSPQFLFERSNLASPELVYLAKRALAEYGATRLITSLSPGWEQALAKAAIELEIPYTVAIPYPGRDLEWKRELRIHYLDLLARASEVYQVAEFCNETALIESHLWRMERSDLMLALWDYEFEGEVFSIMSFALKNGKQVANLWEDWKHLYSLRRPQVTFVAQKRVGAQVYQRKD
jgi:hypothetical protein